MFARHKLKATGLTWIFLKGIPKQKILAPRVAGGEVSKSGHMPMTGKR